MTTHSAHVLGTPKWYMASDAKNSRSEDRSTARPSAPPQKGVQPAPGNVVRVVRGAVFE